MATIPQYINRSILILFLLIFLTLNVSAVAVTNITRLTYGTDIGYDYPSWSPDGKKIIYSSGSDNNYSISVMNADGNNSVKLTSGTVPYDIPRWSPGGSKIVFQQSYSIYVVNSNGSNQTFLIAPAENPSISPDGKYIAFDAGGVPGVPVTSDDGIGIFIMNIDGTNVRRLAYDYPHGNLISPSWSPDGKKIVFSRAGIITIMNSDGSNMLSTEQTGYYPKWSPDGKYIAFLSERAGDMFLNMKLYHIYVMNIGGTNVTFSSDHRYRGKAVIVDINASNVTQLTFGNRWDWSLDWSLDGTKIVFDSEVPPTAPKTIHNIYIMTLDFNATSPTAIPTATPTVTQTPTFTPTATATQTPRVPGFSLLVTIISLSILVLIKRIKR
jgi:Tol biopolymer transport system component